MSVAELRHRFGGTWLEHTRLLAETLVVRRARLVEQHHSMVHDQPATVATPVGLLAAENIFTAVGRRFEDFSKAWQRTGPEWDDLLLVFSKACTAVRAVCTMLSIGIRILLYEEEVLQSLSAGPTPQQIDERAQLVRAWDDLGIVTGRFLVHAESMFLNGRRHVGPFTSSLQEFVAI